VESGGFRAESPDSARIQLAGASAIPVSNSMDIPMDSAGIWRNGRNPGASWNGFRWNPLEFRNKY
jgi:hypothetical protein